MFPLTNENLLKIKNSTFSKIPTLESEPTPTRYVTELTERLHKYSRTSSDLRKLLPLVEKNSPKIQKSKFSKILTLGSEPSSTGYVTEVSERLHHYCRTSSNLKKLLPSVKKKKKFAKNSKIKIFKNPHVGV